MVRPRASVIIATLYRPTLRRALASLHAQTLRIGEDFEVMPWRTGRNEYDARNMAAEEAEGEYLVFLDDDAYVDRDYLARGIAHMDASERLMIMDTALEGDMWGKGPTKVDMPYWGIGATLWVRASAFREVGGFDACWGIDPCPRGWRSDTALLYTVLDKYGDGSYLHATDMVVHHPERMKSQWQPAVEVRFYRKFREHVMRHIVPYDPRICQLIAVVGEEEDRKAALAQLDDLVAKGLIKEEEVRKGMTTMRAIVDDLRARGLI